MLSNKILGGGIGMASWNSRELANWRSAKGSSSELMTGVARPAAWAFIDMLVRVVRALASTIGHKPCWVYISKKLQQLINDVDITRDM